MSTSPDPIDVHLFGLNVRVEVSYRLWSGAMEALDVEWMRAFGAPRGTVCRQTMDNERGLAAYWYASQDPDVFRVLTTSANRASIFAVHVTHHVGKG